MMQRDSIQTGKIFTVSMAHMVNDWYMNMIPTLLPFLIAAGIGIGRSAFLVSAFTITSSLLQPVFGYMVDRKNQRWMVYVGTAWMAVMLALLGATDSYACQFALSLLAGLGTAAFHPQASAMISSVGGNRKGLSQSIFSAGGNVGWALTPLLVVPFIQHYGLGASVYFAIPGMLVALMLWFSAPRVEQKTASVSMAFAQVLRTSWRELTKVVVIVAGRSLTYFGLIAFLPLYLQTKHIAVVESGRFLFIMLFSGALGGLCGGYLSDKFGRKAVILVSLMLATPLYFAFISAEGWAMYLFLGLAGAALLSSFSVTVVLSQEIIRANAAMAAGLTLGFGIGIGGLGVGAVGMLIETQGIDYAIRLLASLPILAGALALTLKPGR